MSGIYKSHLKESLAKYELEKQILEEKIKVVKAELELFLEKEKENK